ncbi:UPF0481 protein, partial [Mucuna pruriens]
MTNTPYLSLKFTQLKEAKQIAEKSVPKIQKVAHYLKDRKHFAKHYLPRLVSIGPIHHDKRELKLGEQYKLRWAKMYLERTNQDAETLYRKIASNIQQLKQLFAEGVIGDSLDDEKLSWMLLVDGCSLLQILEKGKLDDPENLEAKVDQLVLVWQDVLLLENQLPYQLLKLLSCHDDDAKLLNSMNEFLKYHHLWTAKSEQGAKKQATLLNSMNEFPKCHRLWTGKSEQGAKKQDTSNVKTNDEDSTLTEEGSASVYLKEEDTLQGEYIVEITPPPPFHLLDYLRRTVLDPPKNHQDHKKETRKKKKKKEKNKDEDDKMITHKNMQELKAAGIKLKKINSRKLDDISFCSGWLRAELELPEIIVDDTTAPTFLNLIAYEMCPDFKNKYEICSFVAFMDSLIDHPDDVKELRSAGVLQNMLGSDEEVANLFNTISSDLVHDTEMYSHVRSKIEKHYKNKWKTWLALAFHTYFSNPWAIIAFLAALVVLLLTFVQTWYTIYPAPSG